MGKFDDNGTLLEECNIDMYLLWQLYRLQFLPNSEQMCMGDVVVMTDVLHPVDIIPVV